MILINDNWEQIYDLQDVSRIIRENYNRGLADELDKFIPEHTDEEYNSLDWELSEKESKIFDLEDENDRLQSDIERLEERIEELGGK